jgi:hypothetical protein
VLYKIPRVPEDLFAKATWMGVQGSGVTNRVTTISEEGVTGFTVTVPGLYLMVLQLLRCTENAGALLAVKAVNDRDMVLPSFIVEEEGFAFLAVTMFMHDLMNVQGWKRHFWFFASGADQATGNFNFRGI